MGPLQSMVVMSRVVFGIMIYSAYAVITSPAATVPVIVVLNMVLNSRWPWVWCPLCPPGGVICPLGAVERTRDAYALGVTIFGDTTQFVVAWLIDWTKDPMIPAWHQIVANVAAIIGVVLLSPHQEVAENGEPLTAQA